MHQERTTAYLKTRDDQNPWFLIILYFLCSPTLLTSTLAAMKRQVMPMSCSVDLNTFLCVAMKRSK